MGQQIGLLILITFRTTFDPITLKDLKYLLEN